MHFLADIDTDENPVHPAASYDVFVQVSPQTIHPQILKQRHNFAGLNNAAGKVRTERAATPIEPHPKVGNLWQATPARPGRPVKLPDEKDIKDL